MNHKRFALIAAILSTQVASPADAGCLDWLFGRSAPAYPYAAGYAPQATVTSLGPPQLVATSTYTGAYPGGPYAAGYTPAVAGVSPYSADFGGVPQASAAQIPAYGAAAYGAPFAGQYYGPVDNASVLTGRPVVPASGAVYGPALPPAAIAPPPATNTSFFGRLFGTNDYQTSYYGVPTTSFRPVTQLDPNTGAPVIVQQPCTSLTQQVQRTPYTSLQPAPAPVAVSPYYGEPSCGSEPPRYAPPTIYNQPTYQPQPQPQQYAPPQSAFPPVSAYGQPSSVSQATALEPLRGYPGASPSDASPISPPQLNSYRPELPAPFQSGSPAWPPLPSSPAPSLAPPTTTFPSSPSSLQAPPLPPTSTWPSTVDVREPSGGSNNLTSRYSDVAPIPAVDGYRAPAWSDSYNRPTTQPVDTGRDRNREAVPAATLAEPRTASVPREANEPALRYASTPSLPLPTEPIPQAPKPRDDSGWFVIEPK